MHSIVILNPKGGCGKSTLAVNLAGYFAQRGKRVALADCDPQRSSSDWLAIRPESEPAIRRADFSNGRIKVAGGTEFLIIDTPAAVHGQRLAGFVKLGQSLVIPMLPSPIDIRAAEHFIEELYSLRHLINRRIRLASVANRVREDTLAAARLDVYLARIKLPTGQKLPYITVLRASQNYIRAAEKGLSIFEFAPAKTTYDREQWKPLLRWLGG